MRHPESLKQHAQELRRNMTPEERRLWYTFLRYYPVPFRRQKMVASYILDFYCAQAKLAIELDGSQHYEEKGQRYDEKRTKVLHEEGIHVLRFSNRDVNQQFRKVCETIDNTVKENIRDSKKLNVQRKTQ